MGKRKITTLVRAEITRKKARLKVKADEVGIYENFGQKEFHDLRNKFSYSHLTYGTMEERQAALLINDFFNWCINFTN